MDTQNIDVLNDVTKTLIDSQKGYEMACEMSDDRPDLRSRFQHRAQQRSQLVSRFQTEVRSLGGSPQTDGGMTGAMHRGFTQFSSLFRDDEKTALDAIDQGEDHLIDEIERNMERDDLNYKTRELLREACASARSGEAFAERLSENYSAG